MNIVNVYYLLYIITVMHTFYVKIKFLIHYSLLCLIIFYCLIIFTQSKHFLIMCVIILYICLLLILLYFIIYRKINNFQYDWFYKKIPYPLLAPNNFWSQCFNFSFANLEECSLGITRFDWKYYNWKCVFLS